MDYTSVLSKVCTIVAKEEAPLVDILPSVYAIDALRLLDSSYEKLLPLPVQRKVLILSRTIGNKVDVWVDAAEKALKKAKVTGVSQLIKNIKKLKISNTRDVAKKWDTKFDLIHTLYTKHKRHLEGTVSPQAYKKLHKYTRNLSSAVNIMSQVRQFGLPQEYNYAGKWVFKALKKYDPATLKRLYKSKTLDKGGLLFIKDALIKPKTKKGKLKAVTPETHPEYFTKGKEKLRLNKPIKSNAKDIEYNPKWTVKNSDDVWYAKSTDPESGEGGYHYTQAFMDKAQENKWPVVKELEGMLPKLRKKYKKDLDDPNPKVNTIALVLSLIDKGVFRLGNTKSEQDDVRGLHNLLVENLKFLKGNRIKFVYTGKQAKTEVINLKVSPQIYALMQDKVKDKKPSDHVFTYRYKNKEVTVRPESVNKYFKKYGSPTSVHKFRHIHSTSMARKLLLEDPKVKSSDTLAKKKKYLRDSIKKIQTTLGHDSPNTTLNSYIDPAVIKEYKTNMGLTEASVYAAICEVIATTAPTQLDRFKLYKTVWNSKKKSPIFLKNYKHILTDTNKKYGTSFSDFIPRKVLDKFLRKYKTDFSKPMLQLYAKELKTGIPSSLEQINGTSLKTDPKLKLFIKNAEKGIIKEKVIEAYVLLRHSKDYEVRRLVADAIEPELLPSMLEDEDERVRVIVAARLPQDTLDTLVKDPSAKVRALVARRGSAAILDILMLDKDKDVRIVVARRLDPSKLQAMIKDRSVYVRRYVAKRIDINAIPPLLEDTDEEVRRIAVSRIPIEGLVHFKDAEDAEIRLEVARRIAPEELPALRKDPSPEVRAKVASRIDKRYLKGMMKDVNGDVRNEVAIRISAKYLPDMLKDLDSYTRSSVVKRVDRSLLPGMMNDPSSDVRKEVARRIDPSYIPKMLFKTGNRETNTILVNRVSLDTVKQWAEDTVSGKLKTVRPTTKAVIASRLPLDELEKYRDVPVFDRVYQEKMTIAPILIDMPDDPDKLVDHILKGLKKLNITKQTDRIEALDYIWLEQGKASVLEYRDSWLNSSNTDESGILKLLVDGEVYHHDDSLPKNFYGAIEEGNPEMLQELHEGISLSKAVAKAALDIRYPNVDKVALYRGTSSRELKAEGEGVYKGLLNSVSSWSTSKAVARDFVSTHMHGVLLKTTVSKDDVLTSNLFWSLEGNEEEVLLHCSTPREVEVLPLW